MWIRQAGLCFIGLSFGLFVSGGVFTTLMAIGLIPRFSGKTHTGNKAFLYEEMVVYGIIFGNIISVFYEQITGFLCKYLKATEKWNIAGKSILSFLGLFMGMFVGCLALAAAELIDTIPIFTRRLNLRRGIRAVIFGMAFGKLAGSLLYYSQNIK